MGYPRGQFNQGGFATSCRTLLVDAILIFKTYLCPNNNWQYMTAGPNPLVSLRLYRIKDIPALPTSQVHPEKQNWC